MVSQLWVFKHHVRVGVGEVGLVAANDVTDVRHFELSCWKLRDLYD